MGARTLTCIEENIHGGFGVGMVNKALADGILDVWSGDAYASLHFLSDLSQLGEVGLCDNMVRMRRRRGR